MKTKVLFTFGGMPHYLVALLNRLQDGYNVEVSVLLPEQSFATLGKGVKQSYDGIHFNIVSTKEYDTLVGKPYFKGLYSILNKISPDILVIGWPYIIGLSFDFKLLNLIKKKKIGLIYREIPFNVAPKYDSYSFYKRNPIYNEDLKITNPRGLLFYPWAFLLKKLRQRYYKLADATLAYAEIAYDIHQSFGIEKNRIFVSCNSPDTDKLLEAKKKLQHLPLILAENKYRLIHVGRLVRWKKVDLILLAMSKLNSAFPGIELIVVGDGPEQENLVNLSRQLHLEKSVRFIGPVYDPVLLGQYFRSSSIYVLAGMGGLSINEAMAFAKPVICSVCDGTEKMLVREGFNGLYFKADDADDLSSKIELLLKNLDMIEKMGINSEVIIEKEINLDTVAEKFIESFNFVMANK